MAVIKSGDSTDQLHVDPYMAAFVTVRDSAGNEVIFSGGSGEGLTDTELRATPVPVDVTFPANIALTDAQLRATPVPVDVTFPGTQSVSVSNFPATQPVSAASLPLPSGAATSTNQATEITALAPLANLDTPLSTLSRSADLVQSGSAAVGVGLTVTLPAVASKFHYITLIEIGKYSTANITGNATPVIVQTTNLSSLSFTFGSNGSLGTVETRGPYVPAMPLKSNVANTATTIVCPATANTIWRVNVWYQAAA